LKAPTGYGSNIETNATAHMRRGDSDQSIVNIEENEDLLVIIDGTRNRPKQAKINTPLCLMWLFCWLL